MNTSTDKLAYKATSTEQYQKMQQISTTSDGSTASYYELPENIVKHRNIDSNSMQGVVAELQDLISYKDMNAQLGEIFRACYRYGQVSHSSKLRDIKKIIFYAEAELARLEAAPSAIDTEA